jgi:sugar phosphate permease
MSPTEAGSLEQRTMAKVSWRVLPLVVVIYVVAYIDRTNVGFAALGMNREPGFTAYVYGWGAGIFFLGYFLFEVPSNIALARFGARKWIARIMIFWGIVAAAMAFTAGPVSFFVLRFLLGVAEAGFFPGVILYFTFWFPRKYRARVIATLFLAVPGKEQTAIESSQGTKSLMQTLSDRRVLVLSLIYMTIVTATYGVTFFLPLIVKGMGNLTSLETGLVTAVPYVVGTIGMILWSFSSDRRRERRWHFIIACIVAALGLIAASRLRQLVLRNCRDVRRDDRSIRVQARVLAAAFGIPVRNGRSGWNRARQLNWKFRGLRGTLCRRLAQGLLRHLRIRTLFPGGLRHCVGCYRILRRGSPLKRYGRAFGCMIARYPWQPN